MRRGWRVELRDKRDANEVSLRLNAGAYRMHCSAQAWTPSTLAASRTANVKRGRSKSGKKAKRAGGCP